MIFQITVNKSIGRISVYCYYHEYVMCVLIYRVFKKMLLLVRRIYPIRTISFVSVIKWLPYKY